MDEHGHCEHCILRLGFGPRRKRVVLLLTAHAELDIEEFHGVLIVETEGGMRARGHVLEQGPMIEPDRRSA